MARVEIDPETGCWIWKGLWVVMPYGVYPRIERHGMKMSARRAVWVMKTGERLKSGDDVRATCGNKFCVAYEHLRKMNIGQLRIEAQLKAADEAANRDRLEAEALDEFGSMFDEEGEHGD